MRRITFVPMMLLVSFCLFAQESTPEMEAYVKAATPGKYHQMIANCVGEWKVVQTSWFQPGAAPVKSEGSSSRKMILGGRFLMNEHKGSVAGWPFEGLGILGYDNVSQNFDLTWRSTMETDVTIATGNYDEKTKTIDLKGVMNEAVNGPMEYRFTITFVDKDHFVEKMYGVMNGENWQMMQMDYTRVK